MNPAMPGDADQNFKDQDIGDPVKPCGNGATLYHVRVVEMETKQAYETTLRAAAAASTTHDLYKVVHKATKDDIWQQMQDSEHGDIFTSDTHTYIPDKGKPVATHGNKALGICGYNWHWKGDNTDAGQVILVDDMCDALRVGTAPTAAVIIGCRSADLLKKIIDNAAAKVAFGIQSDIVDVDVNSVQASGAATEITAALMRGDTIEDAAYAGTAKLTFGGQTVTYELARGVSARKSLAGNKLL